MYAVIKSGGKQYRVKAGQTCVWRSSPVKSARRSSSATC